MVETSPVVPPPVPQCAKMWGLKGEKKTKGWLFCCLSVCFSSQLAQPLNEKAPLLPRLTKRSLTSGQFPDSLAAARDAGRDFKGNTAPCKCSLVLRVVLPVALFYLL